MGRPPWPRALVQTGCALRDGHRLIRLGAGSTFVGRTPCLSQPSHGMQASGVHAVRQLTKARCAPGERRPTPQLACQWDGRITSKKRYNVRRSARPRGAPHLQPASTERSRRHRRSENCCCPTLFDEASRSSSDIRASASLLWSTSKDFVQCIGDRGPGVAQANGGSADLFWLRTEFCAG